MGKIVMLGKLAIEKTVKSEGNSSETGGFFKVPENLNNFGTVRFIAPELVTQTLFEGAQVYYGANCEQFRMQGLEVLIMKPDNVIAALVNE